MNYKQWADKYPDSCVIRKEGFYYTARGNAAEILSEILGYKLYKSGSSVATGGTSLDNIVEALTKNRINYTIVENDKVVDEGRFDFSDYQVANNKRSCNESREHALLAPVQTVNSYSQSVLNQSIDKVSDPEYEEFKRRCGICLNDQQDVAVQQVDGPVLLLAVPGSGKTTVLVARLGYMIYMKGIDPGNILTVTYTVAATGDMKERFRSRFGEEYADLLEFRTINGVCQKILSYYGWTIGKKSFEVADKQATEIMRQAFRSVNDEFATENDIKNIATAISYVKNMRLTQEQIETLDAGVENFADIYREYNAGLKQRRLIDYDDQMVYALIILEKNPEILTHFQDIYRYICVDEAQDTSRIQHDIIRLLASKHRNLFMVGDEDQSIYGFRAAYPQGLLDFEKIYPDAKVLLMESNYRSCNEIVRTADCFIQRNQYRHAKKMGAVRETDGCVKKIELESRRNQYGYLRKVALECCSSTAVLYRNNESAIPLIDLLEREQIPFKLKKSDMVFFSHPVVTDVVDILHYSLNPADGEIFMRIYYKIGASIKKVYAQQMVELSEGNKPILPLIQRMEEVPFYIKKACREIQKTLCNIASESAGRAVYQVLHELGYQNYITHRSLDKGKADILQILANNSGTVPEFLRRLTQLQELIENGIGDNQSKFVLSTIHSSKGLEYDRVFLLDMVKGILPSGAEPRRSAAEAEKMLYEEERRLFYVAMTRAKNELSVFLFKKDETSPFSEEIFRPAVDGGRLQAAPTRPVASTRKATTTRKAASIRELSEPEEIRLRKKDFKKGTVVQHSMFGRGVIVDRNGDKIEVSFDSGKQTALDLDYVIRKDMIVSLAE